VAVDRLGPRVDVPRLPRQPPPDHPAYFAGGGGGLKGYDGRPHRGKLHTRTAADLEPAYPHWGDFRQVRDRLDPDRVFTNDYLRCVLGP
jgi:L-gulonolactone oxidase